MTTHTNKIQNEAMYINLIIQTKKKQNYITVFQINVIYIYTLSFFLSKIITHAYIYTRDYQAHIH